MKEELGSRQTARRDAATRRDFFLSAAPPLATTVLSQVMRGAESTAPRSKMGIASTSFVAGTPMAVAVGPASAAAAATGVPRRPRGRDALEFLEKCHLLGASGIQTQINGDIPKLRARAEQLGMWLEGMVGVPRNGDNSAFERSLADAKAAGATALRAALLGGRRYESFPTLADWNKWVEETHRALKLVVPIIEKHKVTVAIENHKDWTLEDMQRLLKTYSGEYLGACLDFGNNIALLDDPMEMAEALAPYAKATHIKDMAVRPYPDGFLLSEVPLGAGFLDLPRMVSTLQKTNHNLHFSLEMITRDPLKVPCMTPQYWAVFPDRSGRYLAQTFRLVRDHGSNDSLPLVSQLSREEYVRVEEENVKTCFRYVREKQLIT